MSNKPLPQQIYRHFKGNLYRIVTLAKHSETGEELVIYQALYGDYQVYAREISMFLGPVDKVKYPDAQQDCRFELCDELIQAPGVKNRDVKSRYGFEGQEDMEEPKQQEAAIKEASAQEENEELNIDPLVLEYLDADSYGERLNILTALQHRITDEMINTMAIAIDHEIEEGDTQERYEELKNCLLTLERFECNRLR
ncbi:MAG: DUF1653 domain-containing protein [Lachnospiraceae bacterium]|nr:DUF1653 domain-containing protein [Lachnospiraceae bacterium]